MTFDKLHDQIRELKAKSGLSTILLLPPPIYISDIIINIKKGDESNNVPFKKLSSGEQQLTLSLYSILYHVKNVDYGKDKLGDGKNYKYLNIIMEEVELYFHPEFQRKFVYKLVAMFKNSGLRKIKGINIMMVTHSPFVLSDIPQSNLLLLKKGESAKCEKETLGANILDMLGESFFMESTIGELLNYKIDKILKIYDSYKSNRSNGQWKRQYERIKDVLKMLSEMVSDNYIQSSLKYIMDELESVSSTVVGGDSKNKSVESSYIELMQKEKEFEELISKK